MHKLKKERGCVVVVCGAGQFVLASGGSSEHTTIRKDVTPEGEVTVTAGTHTVTDTHWWSVITIYPRALRLWGSLMWTCWSNMTQGLKLKGFCFVALFPVQAETIPHSSGGAGIYWECLLGVCQHLASTNNPWESHHHETNTTTITINCACIVTNSNQM